jgi:hypothetical protein
MESLRLGKLVRRVTVLEKDSAGDLTPIVVYKAKKKKKKSTQGLNVADRWVRRMADATADFAQTYADRHQTSNAKSKDGWLRDMALNVARASRKGTKSLKPERLIIP